MIKSEDVEKRRKDLEKDRENNVLESLIRKNEKLKSFENLLHI
jgi:hypothetical protein